MQAQLSWVKGKKQNNVVFWQDSDQLTTGGEWRRERIIFSLRLFTRRGTLHAEIYQRGGYMQKFTWAGVKRKNLLEGGLHIKFYSRWGYTLKCTQGGVTR